MNSSYSDALSNSGFYLACAIIYSILYWSLIANKFSGKSIFYCGIMVAFEGLMAYDATYYPKTETIINNYYVHIVVLIHILICYASVDWRVIRRGMGEFIDDIRRIFSVSYNLTYICYNATNLLKIKARK